MRKLFVGLSLFLISCANSEGTSTGNPLVSVRFASFSPAMMQKAELEAMTVSSLKMCFKRLRFKPASGLDENIDIEIGETTLSTAGNFLISTPVKPGVYSRVEFDLNDHCSSGKSVQVTNTNGSFSTTETMTIRFEGTLTITGAQTVDLNIQKIIRNLDAVNSDNAIKTKAEADNGTL